MPRQTTGGWLPRSESHWIGYPYAIVVVAGATALSWWCRALLALPDIVVLYMLSITVVASRGGRGPSTLAAALSVASYSYFFIPPVFAFRVDDSRHLLTFAMMFAVALISSALIGRIRRQEREATEREQRTVALSELSQKLAEDARVAALRAQTEEMRSSLLSAVSHDLRTPLAAITGAATTLRDGPQALATTERNDLIALICDEAERLERLVGNLLYMTRLESEGFEVKREWTSLDEICLGAIERFEASPGRIGVTLDLPEEQVLVSVDPVLMEQVLINLLDNADKYAASGGVVEIFARATGDEIEIQVRDHGPGLPPSSSEKVFDKFFRGVHGGTPGAGLGLSICRGIVKSHGGTLTAANRATGGAAFRVVLPIAINAPPVRRHASVDGDAGGPV
jgi:two-component system sensor histidine kinase KdpD